MHKMAFCGFRDILAKGMCQPFALQCRMLNW